MPESSGMACTAFGIVMAAAPLFAPDVIVNASINRVVNRDNVMARMRNAPIASQPDAERRVEPSGHGDISRVVK